VTPTDAERAALVRALREPASTNIAMRAGASLAAIYLESDGVDLARLAAENAELRARHNPEVCVDTMELCDRLAADNERLMAALDFLERKHPRWHTTVQKWLRGYDEATTYNHQQGHAPTPNTTGADRDHIAALEAVLRELLAAVDDAMESPSEAASLARTGDMRGYIDRARALLPERKP